MYFESNSVAVTLRLLIQAAILQFCHIHIYKMPEKLSKRGKNLQVYVIMKLGLDAAAYDGLGFGANFKRHIKKRKLWF